MAGKKAKLGKSLTALLSETVKEQAEKSDQSGLAPIQVGELQQGETITMLPVEFLQPGRYQPRREMQSEALEELAASIKAQGLMQPIIVRPVSGDNRYEIIAGERRWRATQLAQIHEIACIVRDVSDEATVAMALIENIQREDLNPIEEAIALKRLQEEFELTQAEVAEAVGKSRSTVTNLLRLMMLTPDVRTYLEHGDIEMGHARAMLTLADADQKSVASQVIAKGLSVRQAEALVRKLQQPTAEKQEKPVSADIQRLESDLSEKIGVPVSIDHSAKGKGKLVLKYNSLDELDGILAHIG